LAFQNGYSDIPPPLGERADRLTRRRGMNGAGSVNGEENEMSSPTPDAIDRYFETDARRDPDALVELFADDAVVVDERQTIEGRDAIRAWRSEGSASKYTYTTEITDTEQLDPNRWVVSARLTGNFPGGTADLRFAFTLDRGRIERLVIAP
jgi:hypothetical protein